MISTLFKALFGCRHTNYSFPITMPASARRRYAAVPTGTNKHTRRTLANYVKRIAGSDDRSGETITPF